MPPPQARNQVRPARRVQHAKASRARVAALGIRARADCLAAQQRAQAPLRQTGFRARPQQQPAVPAGGGDESDPEDGRILEPAGDGGSEAGHPGSDDEMAGGVAAILGQPGDLLALLPGYRVRVRLLLGGPPLAAGLLGQAAVGDPPPPRPFPPACGHCHTIPYHKGVCCSNVGVRDPVPKVPCYGVAQGEGCVLWRGAESAG